MLGRVSVPILPYQGRNVTANAPLSTVAIYNAMGHGGAAVDDRGRVNSAATLAYVYTDRNGGSVMANPATCDEFGGPLDLARVGGVTYFSFFGFPGTYHLKVTLADGTAFGIPFVHVPLTDTWVTRDQMTFWHADYGASGASGADQKSVGNIALNSGTDLVVDVTVPEELGIFNTLGTANNHMWLGANAGSGTNRDPYGPSSGSSEPLLTSIFDRLVIAESSYVQHTLTSPSATTLAGIGIGVNNAVVIAANPTTPLILMYARFSDLTWWIYCAKGTGTGNTASLQLTGVDAPSDPAATSGNRGVDRMKLVYNPNAGILEGWVNGWFGGRLTLGSKTPRLVTQSSNNALSIFCQGGSTAGAIVENFWYNWRTRVGMP